MPLSFYEAVSIPSCLCSSGGRGGDYEEIRDKPQVRLLNNGSLHIISVTETAEGFYLCQANNSIGSPLGKVVELRVNCEYFLIHDPGSSSILFRFKSTL